MRPYLLVIAFAISLVIFGWSDGVVLLGWLIGLGAVVLIAALHTKWPEV